MSLQFIFGNSGSGKSDFLYDSVLKQAKEQCASAFELQKNPPPPVAGGNPPQEDDMAKWRAEAGLPPKK